MKFLSNQSIATLVILTRCDLTFSIFSSILQSVLSSAYLYRVVSFKDAKMSFKKMLNELG